MKQRVMRQKAVRQPVAIAKAASGLSTVQVLFASAFAAAIFSLILRALL